MKIINIVLFMLWFFSILVFFSDSRERFHLSQGASLAIVAICSIALAGGYLAEHLIGRSRPK